MAQHNYSYEKRQRDLAKKKKQEEKRLRKANKSQAPKDGEDAEAPAGDESQP